MEITYIRKGDYLYPNLAIDPEDQVDVGKYGQMRRRYLKEHRPGLYGALWIEGKLTPHLLEINDTAFAQIELIVRQLLKAYPEGTQVRVIAELNKWYQVEDPLTGAVGFVNTAYVD